MTTIKSSKSPVPSTGSSAMQLARKSGGRRLSPGYVWKVKKPRKVRQSLAFRVATRVVEHPVLHGFWSGREETPLILPVSNTVIPFVAVAPRPSVEIVKQQSVLEQDEWLEVKAALHRLPRHVNHPPTIPIANKFSVLDVDNANTDSTDLAQQSAADMANNVSVEDSEPEVNVLRNCVNVEDLGKVTTLPLPVMPNLSETHLTFAPTPKQLSILQRAIPITKEDLAMARTKKPHSHGVTAHERRILEHNMLEELIKCGARKVHVVGGSPVRLRNVPIELWFSNPLHSGTDVISSMKRKEANFCQHEFPCSCFSADAVLFVHSVYRYTAEQVAQMVVRTRLQMGASVNHLFQDASGVCSGELHWDRIGERVIGSVRTSEGVVTSKFDNPNTDWLLADRVFHYASGSLCWNMHRDIGSTHGILFKYTSELVPCSPVPTSFEVVLKNELYYGDCTPFVPRYKDAVPVVSSFLEVRWPSFRVISVGPAFLLYCSGNDSVRVPKLLVARLSAKMVFKTREYGSLQSLVQRAETIASDYPHPAELGDKILAAAVALSFVSNIDVELDLLHGIIKDQSWKFSRYNNALKFQFSRELTYYARDYNGKMRPWVLPAIGGALAAPVAMKSKLGALALATGGLFAGMWQWHSRRSAVRVKRSYPKKVSTIPEKEYGGQRIHRRKAEDGKDKDVWIVGPVLSNFRPVAMETNSVQNERVGFTNRLCVEPANEEKLFGPMLELFHFVKDHFELIFGKGELIPISHEDYASLLTSSKKKVYLRTLDDLKKKGFDEKDIERVKAFVKDETHLKSPNRFDDQEECECEIKPRIVLPNDPRYTIMVARWCRALTIRLKKKWHIGHFLTYVAGLTGEQLAYWSSEQRDPDIGAWLAQDFSSFDGTVNEFLQRIELYIYKRLGLPEHVAKFLLKGMQVHGWTKLGQFFDAGVRRASGRHNTSLGNSIVNGIVQAFMIFKIFGLQVLTRCRIGVAGDDSLANMPRLSPDVVKSFMADMGLISKPFVCERLMDLEILSCRPFNVQPYTIEVDKVPVVLDYVFAPKPFKFLAKIGTTVTKPSFADAPTDQQYLERSRSHYSAVCHGVSMTMSGIPAISNYVNRCAQMGSEKSIAPCEHKVQHSIHHRVSVQGKAAFMDYYGYSQTELDELSQVEYSHGFTASELWDRGLLRDLEPPTTTCRIGADWSWRYSWSGTVPPMKLFASIMSVAG